MACGLWLLHRVLPACLSTLSGYCAMLFPLLTTVADCEEGDAGRMARQAGVLQVVFGLKVFGPRDPSS